MSDWVIYGLRENSVGSKYRYIGYTTKGRDERLRLHIADAKKKTTPVALWIVSREFNIVSDTIEECPEGDMEHLYSREIYWIEHYRALQGSLADKRTGDYLKNFQNGGGQGSLGTQLSDDHKESIRASVVAHFEANGQRSVYSYWLEKYGPEEADRLMGEASKAKSAAQSGEKNHMFGRSGQAAPCYGRVGDKHPMFGKGHSDEAKAKISQAQKGKKLSDATKIRMSFAQHTRSHGLKIKETCIWCLGADLQTEIQKREIELNGNKVE